MHRAVQDKGYPCRVSLIAVQDVECDLQDPPELEETQNDYTIGQERFAVRPSVLSEKQEEVDMARLEGSATEVCQSPTQPPRQCQLCPSLPQPEFLQQPRVEVDQDPPRQTIPTITLAPTLHRQDHQSQCRRHVRDGERVLQTHEQLDIRLDM